MGSWWNIAKALTEGKKSSSKSYKGSKPKFSARPKKLIPRKTPKDYKQMGVSRTTDAEKAATKKKYQGKTADALLRERMRKDKNR